MGILIISALIALVIAFSIGVFHFTVVKSEKAKTNAISKEIIYKFTKEDDECLDELIAFVEKYPIRYKISE